ncbi:MAG: hypothetical protein H2069_00755 [Legionella sp.]|nr:hypothetical protein [Legionella sp.]
MSLYKQVADKLNGEGFDFDNEQLRCSDIIEYMILEAAGALPDLQGKPLKCIFLEGQKSNRNFADDNKRSICQYGLKSVEFDLYRKPIISDAELAAFTKIVSAIEDKFPASACDSEHRYYNRFTTLYAVVMRDQDIEKAINASSLSIAAGDLSGFNLESLLLLRKKLRLYKIADDTLSKLVDRLTTRLNSHLSLHFDPVSIQQMLPRVEKKFEKLLALSKEERKFNHLLNKIQSKSNEWVDKEKQNGGFTFPAKSSLIHSTAPAQLADVAYVNELFSGSLEKARDHFFERPTSQNRFDHFKHICFNAIQKANRKLAKLSIKKVSVILQPLFHAILVGLKAIAGIIAGLTVAPALLAQRYSSNGYIGTFFPMFHRKQSASLAQAETVRLNRGIELVEGNNVALL